jgi:4-amino-4-deoxy-L-arabinose transferase-like glycosyltransferase
MRLLLPLLAAILIAVRIPALVQPMGADQGLYAYVGERILEGELPYLHAWDQKPPAIHYTYALMRLLWPDDGVVALADLAAAAATAALLWLIGRELASTGVGSAAAMLFLLLSNPAFSRLAGVRVRAQGETFIAVAVTAVVWLLARSGGGDSRFAAAGVLLGLAFTYKYNAAVYAVAAVGVLLAARRLNVRRMALLAAGFAVIPLVLLWTLRSALVPLYEATITYNVQYSGETYQGPLHFVRYLLTFPIEHARSDALWTLGGAGCAVLLVFGASRSGRLLIPVAWVAAGCLSVAINGSRGLPQYFVQVAPALALAAAWAASETGGVLRSRMSPAAARAAIAGGLVLVSLATWRVNQFPKLVEQTMFDLRRMTGRITAEAHLARYVDGRKYTAIGGVELARTMRAHSGPDAAVYLFGFTPSAYVHADRPSASRFFWSRPVIAGFNAGKAGYGPMGVLADLERGRPAVVALQVHDWAPDVDDSAHFFLNHPALGPWLRQHYRSAPAPDGFEVWVRRD